jgi:hypothetical protein
MIYKWEKTAPGVLTLFVGGKKDNIPGVGMIYIQVAQNESIIGFCVHIGTSRSKLFQNLEDAKAFAIQMWEMWRPMESTES